MARAFSPCEQPSVSTTTREQSRVVCNSTELVDTAVVQVHRLSCRKGAIDVGDSDQAAIHAANRSSARIFSVLHFRMPEHVEPVWQRVDDYFERQLVREDDVLRHMPERNADAGLPPIAVSASQGKLVHLLIRAMNAKRVIEVGTLGGYSGVWIAKALPSNGQLITLELNAAFAAVAKKNFDMAGVSSRVHVRVGPAIDELRRLASTEPRSFDLVFIDADKPSNPHYFRLAMQLVRAGGVIVVDNVVREGEVADDASTDARVRGTRDMMQLIHETRGVTATALQTVGAKGYDGFLMAIVD